VIDAGGILRAGTSGHLDRHVPTSAKLTWIKDLSVGVDDNLKTTMRCMGRQVDDD
jgi:hypothetical protein